MRILWVNSGGLLPLDTGGKIRSFSIASELARRHEVDLFTYYPGVQHDPHSGLASPFSRVECLGVEVPARGSIRDMIWYAVNSPTTRPYQMFKYSRPVVRRRVRQLMQDRSYDVALCDFLDTAGVMPWDLQIPTILFTHNVEAVIWKRHFLVNQNPLWKLIAWREYRAVARAERKFTSLAHHVLTVSDSDRKAFLEFLPEKRVTTIPTGVDLDYFKPPVQPSLQSHTLVFTGSMDWLPNEDAIVYFATEILPLIHKHIPDVTLSVVGRKPTRKVLALAEKDRAVRVTGAVDDIRPYVRDAAVYIVPLRIGGGTRIKIFEAMAMGSAVVSTSIGAEGLPVRDGEDILLADSAQDFAARVVTLLREPSRRQSIGEAGRNLVESRYGWNKVTDVLEGVIDRVSRPGRGTNYGVRAVIPSS